MSNNVFEQIGNASKLNPFIWTVSNIRLPKNAPWDFSRRKWQIQILNDLSKNIVVIKPAQVGLSTISAAKVLWAAFHIPMRIGYTLPREKDILDMVPTRIDPMIANSPLLSQFTNSDVNSTRRKSLKDSFIHFIEAGTEPRMLDIDMLVNDEVDLSDQDNLDKFAARLYASPYKIRYQMGTPSIPNFGISDLIAISDWKVWHVKCPFCGSWIPFNSDWMEILKVTRHRIYYGGNCCDKCKDIGLNSEVISGGQWIPTFPGRPISGYQVIRTMDVTMSAQELYVTWKKTRIERNFYNFALGLPYVAGGVHLTKEGVLEACLDTTVERQEHGNDKDVYYIGIDQGNVLHFVVLKERADSEDGLELVYATVIDDKLGDPFKQALSLVKRFPKSYVVVDMLPNRHSAVSFVSKLKKAWMAVFQNSISASDTFFAESKSKENIVNILKHDGLDELVNHYIMTGSLRMYSRNDRPDGYIEEVAEHVGALQRTTKVRKLFGIGESSYVAWEATGPDHYAMALLYALTAYNLKKHDKGKGFKIRVFGG